MRGALRRGSFSGLLRAGAVVAFAAGIALPGAAPAAAATASATIDQCTNGGVSPLTPEPCVGSNAAAVSVAIAGINGGNAASYKNWVNGNSNGSKSHWREGEFIPYRVSISGLTAGSHTIDLSYDTVFQSGHAIDYLGSYDATETTSTTPTSIGVPPELIHANNSSPCQDLVNANEMMQGDCVPGTPVSSLAVPVTDISLQNGCGGAGGSFSGTQVAGAIKAYGPAGTSVTGFTYISQNVVSGSNTCTTKFTIEFTSPAVDAAHAIVLAWGGHIASSADWGDGNSASTINGSPYHMALDGLDDAVIGSQDRSMDTSAIIPTLTPTISTTVKGPTGATVSTSAPAALGTAVHDTATLTGGFNPITGTVTYSFFTNGTCAGTASPTQSVTIGASNTVPDSSPQTLGAGNYSYSAHYSGDIHNQPADSTCEPFAMSKASSSISTTVFDNATHAAWTGTEVVGATAYDTATVTGVAGFALTGTVTYSFFTNGTCAGTAGSTRTVTMTAGAVPKSDATGALAAGAYSYKATYSGNGNYTTSTSSCEPFSVATPPTVAAAAQTAPTTVPHALAFTGINAWNLPLTAAVSFGVGGLLILGARSRRRGNGA